METATTIEEVREAVQKWRTSDLSVGLVPTMGFLHEGHESLIKRSVAQNDRTIVSIFVNPIQFGQKEDLETYPKNMEQDSRICLEMGVDLIFAPSVEEMYPNPFFSHVDMSTLTDRLCGRNRPGHFQGVCTVVCKLFNITTPDRAYFGQKDAQQLAIIKKMTEDLNFDIKIIGCPTIREKDGLAKSSRNVRLTEEERRVAPVLYKSLMTAAKAIEEGERNSEKLRQVIRAMLEQEQLLSIEYIEIVDWRSLLPLTEIQKPTLIAAAIRFPTARLIDNFLWE